MYGFDMKYLYLVSELMRYDDTRFLLGDWAIPMSILQ